MPLPSVDPIPFLPARRPLAPLLAHDASYFAASARIASLLWTSMLLPSARGASLTTISDPEDMPKPRGEQRTVDEPVQESRIRWGLCCLVLDTPIKFRSATHAYVWQLSAEDRQAYLNGIALENANALIEVLRYCEALDIRAFRVSSGI